MATNSLDYLRVVVNINDKQNDGNNNDSMVEHTLQNNRDFNQNKTIVYEKKKFETTMSSPHNGSPMKAEILIIDEQNLQMNLLTTDEMPYTNISHKMQFDRVDHNSANFVKTELSLVMDELLVKKKNSCIMRFSNSGEIQAELFYKHLVNFLNKRLHYQKLSLQNIEIAYRDIATAPYLDKESNTDNVRGKPSSHWTMYTCMKDAKQHFRDTQNLLPWLLNEHRRRRQHVKFHQKLQMTLYLYDSWRKSVFKIQLHIFNIHLDYMDSKERNHWHQYMDHTNESCSDPACNFMHTGLTVSLSSHLEAAVAEGICVLMFNIPNNPEIPGDTVEIIQMAYAVIKNRKKKQFELYNKKLDKRKSMYAKTLAKSLHDVRAGPSGAATATGPSSVACKRLTGQIAATKESKPKERRLSLPAMTNHTGVCFTIPQLRADGSNPHPHPISPLPHFHNGNDLCMTPHYLNNLSCWYRKIDEHYSALCSWREKYYKVYFNSTTKLLLNSFQSMPLEEDLIAPLQLSKEEVQQLQHIFEKYRHAENAFQFLYKRAHNTIYEDVLKIYLDTKFFQHNQNSLDLKLKQLNDSVKRLNVSLDYTFNM